MSVGAGGLESSRLDFVPDSDSDDDVDARGVDESLGKGLVEETQAFSDDDVVGGVLGDSTVVPDAAAEQVIMVALCNKAGHYIFALWFLSSIFFFFLFLLA